MYENFRNIGRNIPILVLLPSCSVNQHRNRFGDRLYARFALCIQKPCRATWHPAALLTTLSKYSRYLNLPLDVSLLTSWNCKWSYLFVVRLLFREFRVQTKWKKKKNEREKRKTIPVERFAVEFTGGLEFIFLGSNSLEWSETALADSCFFAKLIRAHGIVVKGRTSPQDDYISKRWKAADTMAQTTSSHTSTCLSFGLLNKLDSVTPNWSFVYDFSWKPCYRLARFIHATHSHRIQSMYFYMELHVSVFTILHNYRLHNCVYVRSWDCIK